MNRKFRLRLAVGLVGVSLILFLAGSTKALPPGFGLQTVVDGAAFPSAMAFTPSGTRLFYTERSSGNIRIYDLVSQTLLPMPFAAVAVFTTGADERGLLGIAVDPEFEVNHFVYVFHHPAASSGRITRFTDMDNIGTNPTVIVDEIPATSFHNGGYIGFGPDGKLYVTVGENGVSSNAQDLSVIPGKVHRFNADGTIPADNPSLASSIWSYGLRNNFGFSFHPVTGSLFLSEPGPSSRDEIDRIVKGGNYGWPDVLGCEGNPSFLDPLLAMTPVVTPNGNLIFSSNRYPAEYLYSLFFGEWNTGRIRRSIILGNPDTRLLPPADFLDLGPASGILDLKMGPDGNIWFSTVDSIRRVLYGLPQTFPAVTRNGTPALGNQIILSLLGNPGDIASLAINISGTPIGKIVPLGTIPSSGVLSARIMIPGDSSLAGRTIVVVGATRQPTDESAFSEPASFQLLPYDPSPACLETN